MDLTPSQITSASFRTVRKGYDPSEVDSLLQVAASALEDAQQHATAMEARARAAIAKLQEQAEQASAGGIDDSSGAARGTDVHVEPDDAEVISRTMLLAQRTADTTVAEAAAEAERILGEARSEADATLESARETKTQMIEDAVAEARQASEVERIGAANEVDELRARREFLLGDVDQLESFLIDQRERLRGAARQIEALCERVPSGLGSVPAPPVSAAGGSGDGTNDDPDGDESGQPELGFDASHAEPDDDVGRSDASQGDSDDEPDVDVTGGSDDEPDLDATMPIDAVTGEGDVAGKQSADDHESSVGEPGEERTAPI